MITSLSFPCDAALANEFLANKDNKQRFIHLLSDHIKQEGISALHAKSDADTLIVQTAVDLAESQDTCIIGDDTDLLIIAVDKTIKAQGKLKTVYLKNKKRRLSNKQDRIWPIQLLVQVHSE